MSSDWQQVSLGNYVHIKHGFAFESSFFTDNTSNNILLTPGNFAVNGGFKSDKLKYYEGEIPGNYILKANDLVITMTDLSKQSDTLGFPARVPNDEHTYLHNQRLGKIVYKKSGLEHDFLYYLMCSPSYRHEILASATGTSVKHTAPNRIENFNFLMPPPQEQRSIADVLKPLDDKIELNRQMCLTLEKIATTLFKSWFVDFDPVKAKMSGHIPQGMDPKLLDLFPERFNESKLGPIPDGWRVKSMDEIADFLNGLALQKYPVKEDSPHFPVIKIAELNRGITQQTAKASIKIPKEYIIDDGDVLFSWSGSLTAILWPHGKGALNQHLFKITSSKFPKWFYYQWILQHMSFYRMIASSKATTMGHIKRQHLSETKAFVPSQSLLQEADKLFAPILSRIINLGAEMRYLANTRDILLPKLISGELRVKDMERI